MMKLFFGLFTALLISFSGILTAQSRLNLAELLIQAETRPQTEAAAKELARQKRLPLAIHLPDKTFMEVRGLRGNQPLYAVIRSPVHPARGGEVLTFAEIRSKFDLTSARLDYGQAAQSSRTEKSRREYLKKSNGLLLIPESTADRVMALDAVSGDLVDMDFIPPNTGILSTPIHALPTPWGTITISDQTVDLVQEFDTSGTFLQSLAPAGGVNTAILDNMRGHEYRPNGNLMVTVASGANTNAVAEFDQGGNYLGNFIANGAGGLNSPWGIWYRASDILVTGGSSPSGIFRYDFNGAFLSVFAPVNTFAEQVVELSDGSVAVAVFSTPQTGVLVFDANGNFLRSLTGVSGNRGVWHLGSGNILTTNGSGVHELDFTTGALVRTVVSGVNARFISLYQTGGGTAGFSATPNPLNLGAVGTGSSVTDSVSVSNPGTATLQIASVTSSNPAFTVDPQNGFVPAGGSMDFGITFTAGGAPGTQTADIIFTHNGPSSPDTVAAVADVLVGISSIDAAVPVTYALHQNYPNPFNPATAIRYSILKAGQVTLTVYDLRGREVAVLVNAYQSQGFYEARFDAAGLASGVYFYRINAGEFSSTRKMMLMR